MNPKKYQNGYEEEFDENSDGWVLVGKVTDPTTAGYVNETLKSYNIPVVIISGSGFFGQAGLNLPSIYSKDLGHFKIHVMKSDRAEAVEILNMILGDNWEKADEEGNEEN